MRKARIIRYILLLVIGLIAVSFYYASRPTQSGRIHISTNPWVGFTPFIYAQEKGWLEETPFRFMWLVDLTDNSRLIERGFTQGFTATQYELLHIGQNRIKPVFLIDRSYGADAILSNRSIEELRSTKEAVQVYLERGTLNEDFFSAFVREYGLKGVRFQKNDASQKSIIQMEFEKQPTILISYEPYLTKLTKKGYGIVASTRTMKSFYVIDALFVDEKTIVGNEKAFERLSELFTLAVERFREDPKEYYETIKGYLEGQSYEDFIASTENIEWLYRGRQDAIINHLESQQVKTDRLER